MTVDLKNYEDILRTLNTEEKILKQRRRIQVFRGEDAVALLKSQNLDASQVKSVIQDLLDESILFKISVSNKDPRDCDIVLDQKFNENQYYVLADEKSSNFNFILCGLFVLITFGIVLFRMWPKNIQQRLFPLLIYPLGGFIVFIFILAIIRSILFAVTYFSHPPGIWLFPNLFEDVGFFESFVPVWEYNKKKSNTE